MSTTGNKPLSKRTAIVPEYHDISTAVMLATFLPGGGQLYNGQTVKGVLFVVLTFAALFGVTLYPSRFTIFLGGMGEIIIWLVGMLDAAIIARRLRRRETVSGWKWF